MSRRPRRVLGAAPTAETAAETAAGTAAGTAAAAALPAVGGEVSGAAEPGGLPRLTLYRRAGCHLCEDLETTLYELVPAERFMLQRVDIDADPALLERFATRVPVLMCGERLLCEYFLDLDAMRSVLAGYNTPMT